MGNEVTSNCFGGCRVKDERRRRVAIEMAENPSGGLPQQMGGWAALKRAYRLLRCEVEGEGPTRR